MISVNVAVLGLGLIGGSLLRALAAAGHWTIGYDLDPATRAMARTAAAQAPKDSRWLIAPSVADAVRSAELVVMATPLTAVAPVVSEIAATGYAGLLTDVVSVKEPVRDLIVRRTSDITGGAVRYVGGHPMAGRETTGFGAGDPSLFRGCAWVLCLDDADDADGADADDPVFADWLTVARLVSGLGARVVATTPAEHDRAVAMVSHVPHLLAAALALALRDPLAATLAAGSFRDATRVASGTPDLVANMCGGNSDFVLDALDAVATQLDTVRDGLTSADPIGSVRRWAAPAHAARASWPHGWGEPHTVPATRSHVLAVGRRGGWITAVGADDRSLTATYPV